MMICTVSFIYCDRSLRDTFSVYPTTSYTEYARMVAYRNQCCGFDVGLLEYRTLQQSPENAK